MLTPALLLLASLGAGLQPGQAAAPPATPQSPPEGSTATTAEPAAGVTATADAVDGTDPADERPREEATVGASGKGLVPSVDFYLPEGELDFRLNGLIKGSFYEGQVRYNFLDGDIEAFLRYRYYGFSKVFQIEVFDAIEFGAIEKRSDEFERVRGGLFLIEWPHTYDRRAFVLAEVDRISSNKEEFRFTTSRTDTFLRVGYQIGTPNDVRSNAIVGNRRAAIQNLFTAHREVGPFGAGFTGALTYGFDVIGGDFRYVKLEVAALKRFNLPNRHFFVARVQGGTFFDKELVRDDPDLEPIDRFSIPRGAFFRLDGRENLKGLEERRRGTELALTTVEYFIPWFVGESRPALKLDWQNWYWILYGGYGTAGFERDVLTDSSTYVTDVGFGFETSFRLRDYTFFLSGIFAKALDSESDVEARFAFKSYH